MVHYLAAALMAASALATPGKVQWQADYGKALEATRSDQRPLLVVLDIPSDPKASLDSSLLSTDGEQASLLGSYDLCRVDVTSEYGKKVAEAFHATQFPHTAIIDKTGAVVLGKKSGQMTGQEWQTLLTTYQKGERGQTQTAFYGSTPASTTVTSPSYCPLCQKRAAAMGL